MSRHLIMPLFSRLAACAAGLDRFESMATAFDFGEDVVGFGAPHEGRGLLVPLLDEASDGFDQIGDAGKTAAAHGLAGEFRKPALYQIEPTRTARDEVQFEARVAG